MRYSYLLFWTLITASNFVSRAHACSVPVFRYALERWENAPFQALVFHRGGLAGADKQLVEALKKTADSPKCMANVAVETIDLDKLPDTKAGKATQRLWAAQKNPALPWTVILYPDSNAELEPFWAGALNQDVIGRLVSSPARTEIARRLTDGDAIVWVQLLTGDSAKDDAAKKMLEAELATLQKTIALPSDEDTQGGPTVKIRSDIPLKIAFSVVSVSRTDPAEAMFSGMLMGIDKRFRDATKPVVFPIFGRGRALTGLTGKDFVAKTIEEATVFLTGACSCQVKELNPGVDLLFDTDWETLLSAERRPEPAAPKTSVPETKKTPVLVELPKAPAILSEKPVAAVESKIENAVPSSRDTNNTWILAGVILSGMMVLATGVLLIRSKHRA